MITIGLVPMASRPYHAGHDALIRIASEENNRVIVYVSTTDRENVSGEAMTKVWKNMIEPTLPSNVEIVYGGSPVGNAFKVMGDADQAGSVDTYTIYSDTEDANRFDALHKYAGNMVANGQIKLRAVERPSTVNVSGTQMRQWLASGDQSNFIAHLPRGIDGEAVWSLLKSSTPTKQIPKKNKKTPASEGLVREFVRLQLGRK